MTLSRRGLLTGLAAALAAPAVIRTPGLLMPVRPVPVSPAWDFANHPRLFKGEMLDGLDLASGWLPRFVLVKRLAHWEMASAEAFKTIPFEGTGHPMMIDIVRGTTRPLTEDEKQVRALPEGVSLAEALGLIRTV